MSREFPSERHAGARPVADAPVDVLLARADELARRWVIALVGARPLAEMTGVALEQLAREAPALCAQLARALSSNAEFAKLLAPAGTEGGGDALARGDALGARIEPAVATRDVEALRAVVWEAVLGELRDPTARQVADLSDRLAFVCSALLAVQLERHTPSSGLQAPGATAAPAAEQVLYSSPRTSAGARGAVLIDERVEAPAAPPRPRQAPLAGSAAMRRAEPGRPDDETTPARGDSRVATATVPRPRPWDAPLDAAASSASGLGAPAPRGPVPDGGEAKMRVRRGPGVLVDERA